MATKKLSANDIIWQRITAAKKQEYIVSSDKLRSTYSLWQKTGEGQYKLITSAPTPAAFDELITW